MNRQLVLIHGRSQENKNSIALKQEWLGALHQGLAKSDLKLPIPETDVRFPYYGDTLFQLAEGKSADDAAQVIVRGEAGDEGEKAFVRAVLEEVREVNGITEAQLAAIAGNAVIEKGVLNWGWVQTILRAIDRDVPYGSGTAVALATRDVYQYLTNSNVGAIIDEGVSQAITPGRESVVVSHSLGTIVAYKILLERGLRDGWKVPLLVTLGSPLAVTAVRDLLRRKLPLRCPECATRWFNARDAHDVVALYPLTPDNFPLNPPYPAITNKSDVENLTSNRHGISGYLSDKEVARRIYDALVA